MTRMPARTCLAALLLVLGLTSIWPAVARAQTETELLNIELTPAASGRTVVYQSPQSVGTIGTAAFPHRGFDYYIERLTAASSGRTHTRFCVRFAMPYAHTLDHKESLRKITLHLGSRALRFEQALQERDRSLCWYVRVASADFELQAGAEVSLRAVTIDRIPVLSISSKPSNGDTYLRGETIRFTLSFPFHRYAALRVTGTPTLEVNIGDRVVQAASSLVGLTYIDFRHTVVAGEVDADGVSVAANRMAGSRSLRLNGAHIWNSSTTLTVNLEFEGLPAQAGHKVNGDMSDTIGPTLTNAAVQQREIWLDYDEPLDTTRIPGTGDFTVTVQDESAAIESISFRTSRRLVLRLAESVESGDAVVLSSTAAIEDLSGNREASPPQKLAVTNNTPAETPSLSLSVSDDSVEEGQTVTLTATLGSSVNHEIAVPLKVFPSIALLDANPVITIPAGADEAVLELRSRQRISTIDDLDFTITAQPSEYYSGTPVVSVTLEDRDARYHYRVANSSNLANAVERQGNVATGATFNITATGPSDAPPSSLGLRFHTEGQTATPHEDYIAKSQLITVRQEEFVYSEQRRVWEAAATIFIQILADDEVEGDETLLLLAGLAPGTVPSLVDLCRGTRCALLLTIVDNDLYIQTALEAMGGGSQAAVSEDDGAVGVDFVATLPPSAEEGRELEFRIETKAGSAAIPADYRLRGSSGARTNVRVRPADYRRTGMGGTGPLEARKTIWLDIADDDIAEGTESFVVHLREGLRHSRYIRPVSGKQQVSVQIEDNDKRAVIVSPTALEIPSGGERTYMVSLATQPTGDVTVTLDGPDEAGLDAVPPSLTFTAVDWQTAKAVSVSATEDFAPPDEDTIGHTVTGADYAQVVADSVTVRAVSEDAPPRSRPEISIADASADEGDDTLSFTVTLSETSTETVTVRYRTDDGTAQAGQDYTAVSGTLSFEPNEQTKTIGVPLLDDSSDEPEESLSLILSGSTNAEISDDAAAGTITDNDGPPTIGIRGGSAFESASGVPFFVDLSAPSSFPVAVRYETVEILAANGGATEGVDFEAAVGTLTIAPGTENATVLVPINDDSRDELDETLGLALTAPVNALLGATAANAVGTIQDDDDPPELIVTGDRAAEAAGHVSLTFTLSEASNLPVVAQFETSDGTAHRREATTSARRGR